jgi:hypothetical protein
VAGEELTQFRLRPQRAPRFVRQRVVEPRHASRKSCNSTTHDADQGARLIVDGEDASRRGATGERRECRLHFRRRQVRDDAFPDPGRRHGWVMRRLLQCGIERIAGQVDGDEPERPRNRHESRAALTRVCLRCRMIDREHRRLSQLAEPPRPRVEPGADDHHLVVARGADRIVDRHRPWDDDLCARRQRRNGETLPAVVRSDARPCSFDGGALLESEELLRDGIIETADSQPAVRNRTPLTHEHCRAARAVPVHARPRAGSRAARARPRARRGRRRWAAGPARANRGRGRSRFRPRASGRRS